MPVNGAICFAHRGASGHAPENTLLAVRRACELGAPWLEVDVYVVEGELVVIHDETLERTTNGKGRVEDQTLAQLRSLDAGNGERIPLLREVLDLWRGRAGINIELKGRSTATPVAAVVREYVEKQDWRYDQFLVSSFAWDELKILKQLQPLLAIGLLARNASDQVLHAAKEMEATSIHLNQHVVRQSFVTAAHAEQLRVYVYTVNDGAAIARLLALGVDGIFTDFPELMTRRPS
jgi:glycerophosphoryl diester phosphodiesterase